MIFQLEVCIQDITTAVQGWEGNILTHWGWMTNICLSSLTIIVLDNDLSPGRRQAIIWTSARILLIEPLEKKFIEILIEIITFSFSNMHLKLSSDKWQPFCLGLNVLTYWGWDKMDAISQTTFSSAFPWMKIFEFRLKFHWNFFMRVHLTIFLHWFR